MTQTFHQVLLCSPALRWFSTTSYRKSFDPTVVPALQSTFQAITLFFKAQLRRLSMCAPTQSEMSW